LRRMGDDNEIYQEPSKVTVDDGVVKVEGPDAVEVKMTPEAADETSERLLYGAMQALGQKHLEETLEKQREKSDVAD